jgi:hypothetical protein
MPTPDLQAMADDELNRAITLSWRDLSRVTPWGDTFDGITPGGREVQVERNYLWADLEGGDILVEVTVFAGATRYDDGARATRVLKRG